MRNAKITEEGIVIVKMTSMAYFYMKRSLEKGSDMIVWDWLKPYRAEFDAFWHYICESNIRIYIGYGRREELIPYLKKGFRSARLLEDRTKEWSRSMIYSIKMDKKNIYPISVKKLEKQEEKIKDIRNALKIADEIQMLRFIEDRYVEEKNCKTKINEKNIKEI